MCVHWCSCVLQSASDGIQWRTGWSTVVVDTSDHASHWLVIDDDAAFSIEDVGRCDVIMMLVRVMVMVIVVIVKVMYILNGPPAV